MLPQENTTELTGLVVTIHSGYYTVQTDQTLVICQLRGILKHPYRKTKLCVSGKCVQSEASPRSVSALHSTLATIFPYRLLIAQSILMGGFGMIIAGVVGLMHYASLPYNPFAEYADIFPGESNRTLAAHGFECRGESYNYALHASQGVCSLALKSGAFYHIEVTYSNGVIRHIHFEVRDEMLGLGDLATLLDATQISPKLPFTFHWRGRVGLAGLSRPHNPHFFTGRHVWQVTLTNTPIFDS